MTLPELSIKRPVLAWMLMAGLILFGYLAYRKMGVSQLPDVDFPIVSISLTYEGAAPEVMESDVVDIIEDAVMSVEGIRTVSSYSRYGSASITVEFELNRSIDVALQEVQTKITQAQKNLPKEMDPAIVSKQNPEDQPIIYLSLTNSDTKMTQPELMRFVRDDLKDRFTTVTGVSSVQVRGFIEPNLRLWVSTPKLSQYELTVGDIIDTVNNQHSELPAGQMENGNKETDVRTMGEARSIEEFSNLVISSRGGKINYQSTPIKSVASVEEGLADVRSLSRFNGEKALGLGILKQRGTNAVDVADAVIKRMNEVQKTLPPGMVLHTNFDTSVFIRESVNSMLVTLILAVIFTSVVCFIFLGSWSSTFNVLMAIPTSLLGAFLIIKFFGFTLNTFTLLGLSLSIGIVVDDAIMVLENIVRHREMKKSRVRASREGANEIMTAAIATSIAIIAIFLPVAFMRGVIGRFFFQFGVTMTACVALSLLEALTLTPMRCSEFVEPAKRTSRFGRWIERLLDQSTHLYRSTLRWTLQHRWKVIGGSIAFFLLSMGSIALLRKEFSPTQDQSVFIIRYQTPVGSSLELTDGKFKQAEGWLRARSEIERVFSVVGGIEGNEVNSGLMFITMKEKGKRGRDAEAKHELSQFEFMNVTRRELSKISDLKVIIQDLSSRGFSSGRGFPVEFSIRGADFDVLAKSSEEIAKRVKATGLVSDIDTDYRVGKPELRVYPDRNKAAQWGVPVLEISKTINAMIGGVKSGKYAMGGHRYDIRVRANPGEAMTAEKINQLYVRNNRGELVRMADVVTMEEKPSIQQIARYDRVRAVNVFANIAAGKSQADALAAVESISKEVLPPGYRTVFSGSAQTFKESFEDLIFALIIGIFVAYMVLASQFNSFIDPVTVLIALPFSLSGAFLALLATNQSLNLYSFIGLILLMGIVKKNSILLVEFTNHVRKEKEMPVDEALIEACPVRLRPILMTSIAIIAAAIPEVLHQGTGSETRVPMYICVIGGVTVSTFLTLFVVPCAYSLFVKLERKKRAEEPGDFASVH